MAATRSLAGWLDFIERQHPQTIALGLERVAQVHARLGTSLRCPVVTVGGTNGKGSVCAFIEAILRAAGYRTGMYTSPHLVRYNERVRIDARETDDAQLCAAFEAVERARGDVTLTYFEYGTLAALWLFARTNLDALVLEVGLGGRLDAVNIVDPDCAVIASIGIDHVEYLGHTREAIGAEKAGIFRASRPAVIADPDPPRSVIGYANTIGARLLCIGQDFGYLREAGQWTYWGPQGRRSALAHPSLRGAIQLRNAAAALCALDTLRDRLPLAMQEVRIGLAEARLPGRFQVVPGRPQIVLDVAHNPEAATTLAENLAASGFAPETIAVFGMLRDKDIGGVIRAVAARISRWHVASLPGARGAHAAELRAQLRAAGVSVPVTEHETPVAAFVAARGEANENDKILIFGSFLTVGSVMARIEAERSGVARHG